MVYVGEQYTRELKEIEWEWVDTYTELYHVVIDLDLPVAVKLVVVSYAGLVIAISSTLIPPSTGVIPCCSCTGVSSICSYRQSSILSYTSSSFLSWKVILS